MEIFNSEREDSQLSYTSYLSVLEKASFLRKTQKLSAYSVILSTVIAVISFSTFLFHHSK